MGCSFDLRSCWVFSWPLRLLFLFPLPLAPASLLLWPALALACCLWDYSFLLVMKNGSPEVRPPTPNKQLWNNCILGRLKLLTRDEKLRLLGLIGLLAGGN